jgi:hypothetical protein
MDFVPTSIGDGEVRSGLRRCLRTDRDAGEGGGGERVSSKCRHVGRLRSWPLISFGYGGELLLQCRRVWGKEAVDKMRVVLVGGVQNDNYIRISPGAQNNTKSGTEGVRFKPCP